MTVLFIGKRFYTNRDALCEEYGRIWQLPRHWAEAGIPTRLWLVDYHGRETVRVTDRRLDVISTPVKNLGVCREWLRARKTPVTTVIASGDCYIGLMAYRVARRLGARFVFDVYDKYDEFGGYRRWFGFDSFPFLLHKAAARLFASQALMQALSPNLTHDTIVPNGIDPARFRPHDRDRSRAELGLPQEIIFVGYFGGMEPDRGVADLIAAVQLLRSDGMNVELLLGGTQVDAIDPHQEGVRYLGNVPYDQMPRALACCDMLAVPYRRSAFMDAGASNKIAEAIACRRPIVATRTPNILTNFAQQASVLGSRLATPGDVADLARVITEQLNQPVMADMPEGMTWDAIAARTAARLSLQKAEVVSGTVTPT